MNIKDKKIKKLLDGLYSDYQRKFSSKDPVWNLHKFSDKKDIEILGFIISCYTYGQVDNINKFINNFLYKTADKPYEFTINFVKRKDNKYLKDLNYRFNTADDFEWLIESLSACLRQSGSLNDMFYLKYNDMDENVIPASIEFVKEFYEQGSAGTGKYHKYLLPDPSNGSTCKRWFLYLRWMVRRDEIDTGVWSGIDRSKLIIPVDTHVARISRQLELIDRKTIDLKFAVELTGKLKTFDSADPVKYDFSLCHSGIEKKIIGI